MTMIDDLKARLDRELLKIEERSDLSTKQKINQVRTITCAICAGVAVQPIPFGDIFVLTPLQGLAGHKIARIHGVEITQQQASEILKELAALVGMGLLAQQLAIGAYKTVLPFMGALTTVPLVYGLTYAICSVMDHYFERKAAGLPVDEERIKRLWRQARAKGTAEGKAHHATSKEAENDRPRR